MFVVAMIDPVANFADRERLRSRLAAVPGLSGVPGLFDETGLSGEAGLSGETAMGLPVPNLVLTLERPEDVVTTALLAVRDDGWAIAVGIAERASSGPAMELAVRAAAGLAQRASRRHVPIAVVGAIPSQYLDAAQAVLRLLGRIVASRSEAEWRVVDQLTAGGRGAQGLAAESLGISSQAVSKAVGRSAWDEEQDGRRAAALLLSAARTAVFEWS